MRLILVRHGRTVSNVRHLLDTAVPGPSLDEVGRGQAEDLVGLLRDQRIGWIGSSGLTRARETAAPLAAALGLDVTVLPGLREVAAGDREMCGDEESVRAYLGVVGEWLHGRTEVRMPGAESGTEFFARFDAAVASARSAAAAAGAGTFALVSHGAAIRTWAGSRVGDVDADFVVRTGLLNTGVVELEEAGPTAPDGPDGAPAWVCRRWMGVAVPTARAAAAGAGPAAEPAPARPPASIF
ncbi:histidine phosphatase family protein [Kineococcus gynurae]|uniref:Histidine phosphatase family protein n=1 Tax=Kineococcus gynurae TaxID=452979 RepID=A0ABV5LP42_9ACTN